MRKKIEVSHDDKKRKKPETQVQPYQVNSLMSLETVLESKKGEVKTFFTTGQKDQSSLDAAELTDLAGMHLLNPETLDYVLTRKNELNSACLDSKMTKLAIASAGLLTLAGTLITGITQGWDTQGIFLLSVFSTVATSVATGLGIDDYNRPKRERRKKQMPLLKTVRSYYSQDVHIGDYVFMCIDKAPKIALDGRSEIPKDDRVIRRDFRKNTYLGKVYGIETEHLLCEPCSVDLSDGVYFKIPKTQVVKGLTVASETPLEKLNQRHLNFAVKIDRDNGEIEKSYAGFLDSVRENAIIVRSGHQTKKVYRTRFVFEQYKTGDNRIKQSATVIVPAVRGIEFVQEEKKPEGIYR